MLDYISVSFLRESIFSSEYTGVQSVLVEARVVRRKRCILYSSASRIFVLMSNPLAPLVRHRWGGLVKERKERKHIK